jgi:hypothetical protein
MPSQRLDNRREIIEVLDRIVVRSLKQRGFVGRFPHFRRITSDRIDLLSFFFMPKGHGFVFKFGRCGPGGLVKRNGKRVPPEKVTTGDLMLMQLAWISPDTRSNSPEFWFQYQPENPQSQREAAEKALPYLLQLDV